MYERRSTTGYLCRKKEPLRSWPISVNALDDVASGSDTKE
jgi:hypothetical protein